jgi:hypothetical protein
MTDDISPELEEERAALTGSKWVPEAGMATLSRFSG